MQFKKRINIHKSNRLQVSEETLKKADLILEYLCFSFNQTLENVTSKSRKEDIMIVKSYFSYFAYKYLKMQIKEVAMKINLTHYSTPIYYRDTVEDLMKTDSKIRFQVYKLDKEIKELIK